MCEGTGEQGYPCDGSGEEVRSCNEKKCPGQWLQYICLCIYYPRLKSLYKHFLPETFFFCAAAFPCMQLDPCQRKKKKKEKKKCVCLCVCPICTCTVFVRQNRSDSQWFAPQPKASITILELHSSHLYLSLVYLPVNSHTHQSLPLHWFCTSLPCGALLLSSLFTWEILHFSLYLHLFNIFFFFFFSIALISLAFSRLLSLCVLRVRRSVSECQPLRETVWFSTHASRLKLCVRVNMQVCFPHALALSSDSHSKL